MLGKVIKKHYLCTIKKQQTNLKAERTALKTATKKMKSKSFNSVLPLNKTKREFFKNLVNIYKSADRLAEFGAIKTDTQRIAHLSEIILAFLNGEFISVCDTTRCTTLNQNVINKMRPIRRDKVAIYNALVCYVDELMSNVVIGEEDELVMAIRDEVSPKFILNIVDEYFHKNVQTLIDTKYSHDEDTDNVVVNDADPNIIYVVTYTKDFTDEVLECETEVFKTKAAALEYIREEFNKIVDELVDDDDFNSAVIREKSLSAFIDINGNWYKWETKTFDLSTLK